ncbi:MAG: HD domain-containing protein [Isosphaeraceae bacterium]
MTRRAVKQLSNADVVEEVLLVVDKQLRTNRQGGQYLHLELRDKTGSIGARLWNVPDHLANAFDSGDYLRVQGKTQLFQGSLQLILSRIDPVDSSSIDPSEYLPEAPANLGHLTSRLRAILLDIGDPHLRALAECFLIDDAFMAKFTAAPAGIRNHHAYRGGLLEHVVTMMEAALKIAPLYPELNRDILLVGILLHDVGKIDELSYDRTFGYTDEGQLVGHIIIGVEILRDKVEKTADLTGEPFPREMLLRLKHMITSHHGPAEFGSPKLPMTPEAIALHYLDNLDAKLHVFIREIRDDPARDATWTPFHANLNRRIFKGGGPSSPTEDDA